MEYKLWKPASTELPRNDDVLKQLAMAIVSSRGADTGSASPITATRLDPKVIPTYVRNFPFWELISKVPANGVSHTFLQQTAMSQSVDPHTVAETGVVQPDSNSYLRKTTNIAQIALERGVTLKAQFGGAAAGGASSDLMARELQGGLDTIARDAQNLMLRYQDSDNTQTTSTAAGGKYNADGVNGLRWILANLAPPENSAIVDITTPGWTDQRVLVALRKVVNAILDKGGNPDLIVSPTAGAEALFEDQMSFVRYLKEAARMQITPGLNVGAITTGAGDLPLLPIPGTGVGTWTDGSHTYFDIFVLQTDTLEMPYLGAPEPTIIRIPMAVGGKLSETAIPFSMLGLAAYAPQFLGRVSCKIA